MKNNYIFLGLAMVSLLAFTSCEKNEAELKTNEVTIGVSYEPITDAETKVAIVESSNTFALNWESTDAVYMSQSASASFPKSFAMKGTPSGNHAEFTGDLPTVTGTDPVDYWISFSSFGSRSDYESNKNLRGQIETNQAYTTPDKMGKKAFLAGVVKNCTPGIIGEDFNLKTMNSFIKIPVTKGSSTGSVAYDKMYVTTISISANNGEQISGKLSIDMNSATWYDAYANDGGITAGEKYSTVALNCVSSENPKGIEISSSSIPFYIATAFGTFEKGLTVTFVVRNDAGQEGSMIKTIKNNQPLTLARNSIYSMPSVAVDPTDFTPTYYYQKVTADQTDWSGEYMIIGIDGDNLFRMVNQAGNNIPVTSVIATDNKIYENYFATMAAASVVITKRTSGYTIQLSPTFPACGNYYLYAASSGSNYLRSVAPISGDAPWTDDNSIWEITFTSGAFTIEAQGANARNKMRFNSTSKIISCYGAGQKAVHLYKKVTL